MKNQAMNIITAGRRKRRRRWIIMNSLLGLLSITLCCAMLLLGNTIYTLEEVIGARSGEASDGASFAITTIRLPRMLAGLFAGFAFGIAGNTFQTMLRNPLANPDILGITSGSSVAALFCILVLQTSDTTASIASVISGLGTAALIYILSRGSSFAVGRLIIVGIGIQAMLTAVISYLLMEGAKEDLPTALQWLNGSLNGAQMDTLLPLFLTVAVCAPVVLALGKHLNILELGEQSAFSLGLNTDKTRVMLIVSSVCMIALAASVTGPISFVAFLSGPIAKRLAGAGSSNALPAGLVGVNLVLGADLIGQFAFDVRFPAGIITGVLGAPFLLYLLIRMNRKGSL